MSFFDPISSVIETVGKVIGKVVVDKDARDALMADLAKTQMGIDAAADARESAERLAQVDVNKTEAQSGSLFVSGARPFIMWVGGVGFAYATVVRWMVEDISAVAGHPVILPVYDQSLLVPVLMGLLGLGAMRTVEKVKGVATTSISKWKL